MKSLTNYIAERWVDVHDEDTDEHFTVWIEDETEEQVKARLDRVQKQQEEYERTQKEWKSLRDQWWKYEDEKDEILGEIRNIKANYKQLTIDMEDELGQLISKGEDPDDRAQHYGEELDKLSQQKDKLLVKLHKIEDKIAEITQKMDDLYA